MLPDWCRDVPLELLLSAIVMLVAAALALGVVVSEVQHGRDAIPLSEREARDLKRDQFRAERRARLRELQRRLGFRRRP